MTRRVQSLTGIYHADGSLIGELRYVFGKLTGTAHCALCDITHAGVRRKSSFATGCAALPVPFEAVHLDERTAEVRAFTEGKTPCVIAHTEAGLSVVLDAAALDACGGDDQRFFEALTGALEAAGLTLDGT